MRFPHLVLRALGLLAAATLIAGVVAVARPTPAEANSFGSRPLYRGLTGGDVLELQIRIAGWYSNCAGVPCPTHFPLDSIFGEKTERAMKNFERAYGRPIDGRADGGDFSVLHSLAKPDGSTKHFSWSEFVEKKGTCTSSNSGTFNGGKVTSGQVRENVRRLMYRLEVVRHRVSGKHPVYVGSGFRSVPYNQCVKGKPGSQHQYGTAIDGKMGHLSLGRMRGLAKTSQMHAIFCYSGSRHNHLDIRIDNPATGGSFIWPPTNSSGQDRSIEDGKLCVGGESSPPNTGHHAPAEGPDVLNKPMFDGEVPETEDAEGTAMRESPEQVWMSEDD